MRKERYRGGDSLSSFLLPGFRLRTGGGVDFIEMN